MATTGPFYTLQDLEQLWVNAGGNPQAAPTAAAIAEAESSGGQTSTNVNTNGTTDYGLWQINSAHFVENPGVYNPSQLTADPTYNANAAIMLSGGTKAHPNWSPWSTWYSDPETGTGPGQGPYLGWMQKAQAAFKNVDLTGQTKPTGTGSASSAPPSSSNTGSTSGGFDWMKYLFGSGEDPRTTTQTTTDDNSNVPFMGKIFGLNNTQWSTAIWLLVAIVFLVVAYALITHSGSDEGAPQVKPVPVPV